MEPIDRREFLRRTGTGVAMVSLPPFLASCSGSHRVSRATSLGTSAVQATAFDAFGVDSGLIRKVLSRGLSRGGEFAEIFLQHKVTHWVGLEDGEVNRASSNVDLGAGIRVIKGEGQGFAYTEDLSAEALLRTAETAAAVADGGTGSEPHVFTPQKIETRYPVDVAWTEVGVDRKLPVLEQIDKVARKRDGRIIKVTSSLSDERSRILVANSEGLLVEDDQPMVVIAASCVAEQKGRTETSSQSVSARDGLRFLTTERIDKVAREAADFTICLFDAVPAPVGNLPVVLAPGISGILLHEAMGHGFEADFNRKGVSIYSGKIGQRVAPKEVTILDDGMMAIRGSINIDDEGTLGQKTVLVEEGVLRSYMHDRISAQHFKVPSTGNGRRQSFRFPPVPRMRNTYMMNGPRSPEEIVASVDKGLYAELFSNGQVNIGAGDFTFYLKHGRLIEKGKLGSYVKDANLIGSGPKVLEAVQMVGNDMKIESTAGYCGKDGQRVPVGFGLPTLKVGAISIGGRRA